MPQTMLLSRPTPPPRLRARPHCDGVRGDARGQSPREERDVRERTPLTMLKTGACGPEGRPHQARNLLRPALGLSPASRISGTQRLAL